MNIDLTGKTALVTGSTAGIGYAIANGLAASGAEVAVNGRGQDTVDAAVARLKQGVSGAKVRGIAADVSTAEGCAALLKALPDVDILINNAGIFEPKNFFKIPDEDWSRFFEVNVMSGVRLSRAYLAGMLKRNWGRIVFISSESGLNIPTEMITHVTGGKALPTEIADQIIDRTDGVPLFIEELTKSVIESGLVAEASFEAI